MDEVAGSPPNKDEAKKWNFGQGRARFCFLKQPKQNYNIQHAVQNALGAVYNKDHSFGPLVD